MYGRRSNYRREARVISETLSTHGLWAGSCGVYVSGAQWRVPDVGVFGDQPGGIRFVARPHSDRTKWWLNVGDEHGREWSGLEPCHVVLRVLARLVPSLGRGVGGQPGLDPPELAAVRANVATGHGGLLSGSPAGVRIERSVDRAALATQLQLVAARSRDATLREVLAEAASAGRLDLDALDLLQRSSFLGAATVAFGRGGGVALFQAMLLLPDFQLASGRSVDAVLRSASRSRWELEAGRAKIDRILRGLPGAKLLSTVRGAWEHIWLSRRTAAVLWAGGPLAFVYGGADAAHIERLALREGFHVVRVARGRTAELRASIETIMQVAESPRDANVDWSSFAVWDLVFSAQSHVGSAPVVG